MEREREQKKTKTKTVTVMQAYGPIKGLTIVAGIYVCIYIHYFVRKRGKTCFPTPCFPMDTLSVSTWNIYLGPPLPCFCCPVRSLRRSSRLPSQLSAVEALDPDILCLQEVYHPSICEHYETHLKHTHHIAWSNAPEKAFRRNAIYWLLLLLLISSFTLLVGLCLDATLDLTHPLSFLVVPLLLVTSGFVFYRLSVASVLADFLRGTVIASIAVCYRKQLLTLVENEAFEFIEQRGDLLNCFRPRGFQRLKFESTEPRGGVIWVIHVHLNALGPKSLRRAQLQDALQLEHMTALDTVFLCGDFNTHMENEWTEMVTFLEGAGFTATDPKGKLLTWDAMNNSLTQGWHRVRSHTCDGIFYRKAGHLTLQDTRLIFTGGREPLSDHYGVIAHVRGALRCRSV